MLDSRKMKSFALMQLKGRWTIPVIMAVISIIVSFLFSIPDYGKVDYNELIQAAQTQDMNYLLNFAKSKSQSSGIMFLLTFIELVVTGIITFASLKVYLQMAKGPEPVEFSDYLKGFNYWMKALGAVLWLTLWIFLWVLLFVVADSIIIVALSIAGAAILLPVIQFFLTIGICAFMIYKSISYSYIYYIAAEYEEVSVIKALSLSKQITKGYIWELFVLAFSFIGWILLTVITFGLVNVFVQPYMSLTKINAYHYILGEKLNKGELHTEDFE